MRIYKTTCLLYMNLVLANIIYKRQVVEFLRNTFSTYFETKNIKKCIKGLKCCGKWY